MKRDISGKRKKLTSFIQPFEQVVLRRMVPWVPKWIETYHLTLMTIPFGLVVVGCGYLARESSWWLLGVALCVFLQYVTDILDGAVGRYRNTGLVSWGFYMDHMCDYIFANALVASYTIAFHIDVETFFIAALVTSGFFVHEFLMCSVNGELNKSGYFGFGPTEVRLLVLLSNFVLPFIPRDVVILLIRGAIPIASIIFVWLVFRGQRMLWKLDMHNKQKRGVE